ncbi:MAG TPA: FemAB family XrtA/PEP-CTERM system-associated protein [Steroidobacteraceae bacterium]
MIPAADRALPRTIAVLSNPSADWDEFVTAHPDASVYLLSGWALLAREVFGHPVFFIEARDAAGTLVGVLPMVQQKSLLLGNFATSLPFFNYGGALCAGDDIAAEMMQRGRALGQELGCSYVEFRDAQPRPGDWIRRTDKVSMVLQLPDTFAKLSQQLGSKLRSQAKRADREEPAVRIGGVELVDDFYAVFASTMRDLGTPVYPRKFFPALLRRFPEYCRIIVVDCRGKPAAAGFVVTYNGHAEIPWAACLGEAKPLGFNMKLYWEVLTFVVGQGCSSFDFGRSTIDAGTYKFKKQWGAEPVQLHWHRWEKHAKHDGAHASSGGGKVTDLLSQVWRRMPVQIANRLGPLISPGLPW